MLADREPELCRFWIEFDLPPAPRYDGIVLDGDTSIGRALRGGVGVTAYDEGDAVSLVVGWLVEWEVINEESELPPIARLERDIDFETLHRTHLGNPAWRGIWSPPDNLRGPTPLGGRRR